MNKLSLIAAAVAATVGTAANAVVLLTENFNSPAFFGAFLAVSTSDRFGPTAYFLPNAVNGFSFAPGAFYAIGATGDGAVLLNETSGAATRTLTGLSIGKTYTVSLLLSGDNITGQSYVFDASVDGSPVFSTVGTVLAPGTNPGTTVSFTFVPTATSATLVLSESSLSTASPMIDDFVLSAVPEPATWGLMIAGFGMVGVAARRRRIAITA